MSLDQIVWTLTAILVLLSTVVALAGAHTSARFGPGDDGEFWPLEVISFLFISAVAVVVFYSSGVPNSGNKYLEHYIALSGCFFVIHAFVQPWLTKKIYDDLAYKNRHKIT